ncbi:aquaporin-like protein [Poronia punctata]|nr:aquaporin-like protein [Poronia punctata]
MAEGQDSSLRLNATRSTGNSALIPAGRQGSAATGVSTASGARKGRRMPPRAAPSRRWIDEGYYDENPWFDRERKGPVFSLGGPLPRKARWNKKGKRGGAAVGDAGRTKEELLELGEVTPEPSPLPEEPEEEEREEDAPRQRKTSEGVTHGDKHNTAGQPVFEYMPTKTESHAARGTRHASNSKTQDDEPSFGIDSEPIGRRENEEVEEEDEDPNKYRNWWARFRAQHPEPLAEFLATFVAVFLGLAGTLSVNLSAGQETKYGSYETVCWSFGFAWMFGIYLGGGISGAHMNPAISIILAVFRGFPWKDCSIYILAQFCASMAAAGLAYGCFRDTIRHVDPTKMDTAKTLFSSPPEYVSMGTACFNEVVGSAIMVVAVLALGDDQNNPPGAGMHAFILGLLVTTLKFTLGYNVGSALNPATDFGPRVISYAVGYRGPEVWSTGWWIYGPWLSTIGGSLLGAVIYDGFIFVGSESPVNYRIPETIRKRARRLVNLKT